MVLAGRGHIHGHTKLRPWGQVPHASRSLPIAPLADEYKMGVIRITIYYSQGSPWPRGEVKMNLVFPNRCILALDPAWFVGVRSKTEYGRLRSHHTELYLLSEIYGTPSRARPLTSSCTCSAWRICFTIQIYWIFIGPVTLVSNNSPTVTKNW